MTDVALRELLKKARKHNERANITGILVHIAGTFIQFMEGPGPEVDAVYKQIGRDSRHHDILLVAEDYSPRRYFGSWSMAFEALNESSLAYAVGYRSFDPDLVFAYPEENAKEKLPALILLQNFIRDINS